MNGAARGWKPDDLILGVYQVIRLLGEGGMGVVYHVRHTGWGLDLAVKTPLLSATETGRAIEQFEAEVKAWAGLRLHPHVLTCYFAQHVDRVPRVFSEFAPEGALSEWIYSRRLYQGTREQALKRILSWSRQFASGLQQAHDAGLIHQDVKPSNALVGEGELLKVSDFGLARFKRSSRFASQDDDRGSLVTFAGMTPAYCSPEQYRKQKLTDRTDVWSWALAVLEMFLGELPCKYGGHLGAHVFRSFLLAEQGEAGPVPMPGFLRNLLKECLREDPSRRPAMSEVLREFDNATPHVATGVSLSRDVGLDFFGDDLNNRGVTSWELGDRKAAVQYLDQAVDFNSIDLTATYNRNLVKWRCGLVTDDQLLDSLLRLKGTTGDFDRLHALFLAVNFERRHPPTTEILKPGMPSLDSEATALLSRIPPALLDERGRFSYHKLGGLEGQFIHCLRPFDLGKRLVVAQGLFNVRILDHKERHDLMLQENQFAKKLSALGFSLHDAHVKEQMPYRGIFILSPGENCTHLEGHEDAPTLVAVSSCNKSAISSSYDTVAFERHGEEHSQVLIWDLAAEQKRVFEARFSSRPSFLWIAKGGRFFLVGGTREIHVFYKLNPFLARLNRGVFKLAGCIRADTGEEFRSFDVAGDETCLWIGKASGTLDQWLLNSLERRGTVRLSRESVAQVKCLPSQQMVVVDSGGAVFQLDANGLSPRCLGRIPPSAFRRDVVVTSCGRWLISNGDCVRCWTLPDLRCFHTIIAEDGQRVQGVLGFDQASGTMVVAVNAISEFQSASGGYIVTLPKVFQPDVCVPLEIAKPSLISKKLRLADEIHDILSRVNVGHPVETCRTLTAAMSKPGFERFPAFVRALKRVGGLLAKRTLLDVKLQKTIRRPQYSDALALSHDGRFILCAGSAGVGLIDAEENCKPVWSLPVSGVTHSVHFVPFRPLALAVTRHDGTETLSCIDLESGKVLHSYPGGQTRITATHRCWDGIHHVVEVLVTDEKGADEKRFALYEIDRNMVVLRWMDAHELESALVLPSGEEVLLVARRFYTSYSIQALGVTDAPTNISGFESGFPMRLKTMVSPSARSLYALGLAQTGSTSEFAYKAAIGMWSTDTKEWIYIRELDWAFRGGRDSPEGMNEVHRTFNLDIDGLATSVSADGEWIFCVSDMFLSVFRAVSGEEIWRRKILFSPAKLVEFTPDGEYVAVLTAEGEVQLFSLLWEYGEQRSDSPQDLHPFILGFLNRHREPRENKAGREGRAVWSTDQFQRFVLYLRGLGFSGFDERALLAECDRMAADCFSAHPRAREQSGASESSTPGIAE